MKRILILTCLCIFTSWFCDRVFSQHVVLDWENTIQGNGSVFGAGKESMLQVLKLNSNRLLLACYTQSDSGYDKSMNADPVLPHVSGEWLYMIDSRGNKIWDRDFWGARGWPNGLAQISDDSLVMTVTTQEFTPIYDVTDTFTQPRSNGYNAYATWTLGFDTLGNKQWDKTFDIGLDSTYHIPFTNVAFRFGMCMYDIKAKNGKVFQFGRANPQPTVVGGDVIPNNCLIASPLEQGGPYPSPLKYHDMLLYQLDPKNPSKYEWQHLYGGDSSDVGFRILALNDGGLLLAGITTSNASCNQTVSVHNKPHWDWYVVRTDSVGNPIWQQTYGGNNKEILTGIIDAGNNNYLQTGYTYSPQSFDVTGSSINDTTIWMLMIDSLGNKLWDKRYGGCTGIFHDYSYSNPFLENALPNSVEGLKTSDGGFLFVASVNDSLPCGDVSEPGKGGFDYWLLKLDTQGNKLWDKRYGGTLDDYAEHVVEMSPGHYIVGGISKSPIGGDKSEASLGTTDMWIVAVTDTLLTTSIQHYNFEQSYTIAVSPNPAKDIFTINTTAMDASEKLNLNIFNSLGKEIKSIKSISSSQTINCNGWNTGIYLLKFTDSKGRIGSKKIVKE